MSENRSSGFPTRSNTNQAVQRRKMARVLKFQIYEVEGLYYPCSENKGADQLCGYREADLRLCFRICKKPVFSQRGSYINFTLKMFKNDSAEQTNTYNRPSQIKQKPFFTMQTIHFGHMSRQKDWRSLGSNPRTLVYRANSFTTTPWRLLTLSPACSETPEVRFSLNKAYITKMPIKIFTTTIA